MKGVYNKIAALTGLMMLGLLLLCGCTGSQDALPEMELSSYVPQKGVEQAAFTAQLYFLSDDGLHLSVEEREIAYDGSMSRAEAAVQALIDGPESTVLQDSVPGYMALQRVEASYEACNVYLLASHMPDTREWLTARAAIAATVFACEDIAAVNLYLNGMALGYYGRALGAMQPITTTLDAHITALQQEYKEISQSAITEAGIYENRVATLYFTDETGTLLIAKNVTLNYDSTEQNQAIAGLLINKLMSAATDLEAVLPKDFELAEPVRIMAVNSSNQPDDNPEEGDAPHPDAILPGEMTEQEDTGVERGDPSIAVLSIMEPQEPYSREIMCGALTLTITGYIPDIQGVAINMYSADGRVTSLSGDGYFTREDYTGMIGRIAHMAYPSADGTVLKRVPRAMHGEDSYDPAYILKELFAGISEEYGTHQHITDDDVADVYITGSTVVVDWKAGFEEKLRAFIACDECTLPADTRERMFVYSVVNTLTELEGVSRVWMLEDGEKLGVMDSIYLGNALMRNPGILVDD